MSTLHEFPQPLDEPGGWCPIDDVVIERHREIENLRVATAPSTTIGFSLIPPTVNWSV
nr:hypothetical protein [Halorubrum tropicale]